jgi:hypothetical protein
MHFALILALAAQPYVPGKDRPTEFIIDELPVAPGENEGNWIHARLWALQQNPACVRKGRGGCRVRFRCGTEYTTAREIVLCRSMYLIGCGGGGGWQQSTSLRVTDPSASAAIRIAFAKECRAEESKGGLAVTDGDGSWSVIEGLEIQGAGLNKIDHVKRPQWGIQADGIPILRDLYIHDFTEAVRISAAAHEKPFGKNANVARLDNITINWTAGPGLFIDGPDTNAGYFSAINISYACSHATPELRKALGLTTCAAVYDSSFLGNTYIAPHTAATYRELKPQLTLAVKSCRSTTIRLPSAHTEARITCDVPENNWEEGYLVSATGLSCLEKRRHYVRGVSPGKIIIADNTGKCPDGPLADGEGTLTAEKQYFAGYFTDNLNARNVFLGAYSEADQPWNQHSQNDLVLGGHAGWRGTGMRIGDRHINRLTVINAKNPENLAMIRFGEECPVEGCAMSIDPTVSIPGSHPLRVVIDKPTGTLRWTVAEQANPMMRMGLTKTSTEGLNRMSIQQHAKDLEIGPKRRGR